MFLRFVYRVNVFLPQTRVLLVKRQLVTHVFADALVNEKRSFFTRRAALAVVSSSLSLVALLLLYDDSRRHRRIVDVFAAGHVPSLWDAVDTRDDIVPRVELHEMLMRELRPHLMHSYIVISGEHGTGKSVALRKASRSAGGINGVVYFEVNRVEDFSRDLAACVNARASFYQVMDFLHSFYFPAASDVEASPAISEPMASWLTLSSDLARAAYDFRCIHKRPMTLIIDNADRLAFERPEFLRRLQEFAKTGADSGDLRVVFVSSDKTVMECMKGRSDWSRASAFEVTGTGFQ